MRTVLMRTLGMSNPVAKDVVETLYRIILKREADPIGLEFYTSLIAGGTSASDVAAALFASAEYGPVF